MAPASRILVVDDEPVFADNLRDYLSRGGPDVRVAHDAQSALEAAADFSPEIVLMDCRLGASDGIAVLDRIRLDRPACRALLMTAHPSEDVIHAADALGVSTVLFKPFSFAELRDAMLACQAPTGVLAEIPERRVAERRQCELPSSSPTRFLQGLRARFERRGEHGRRASDG